MTDKVKLLKEEGNELFKSFHFGESADKYSEALAKASESNNKADPELRNEVINLLRNRAMCYIKMGNFEGAVHDCNRGIFLVIFLLHRPTYFSYLVLEVDPSDIKALYRRCEALEHLARYPEAYEDGKKLLQREPHNGAVQSIMRNLTAKINAMVIERDSTPGRLQSMLKFAFDKEGDASKRKQAFSNLLVLSREMEGANIMYASGLVSKFIEILRTEKDPEILSSTISILDYLASKDQARVNTLKSPLWMILFYLFFYRLKKYLTKSQ